MNKHQLLDALSVIHSEEAVVKGSFSFDSEYSSSYSCNITNVTLSYSIDGSWEATIYLEEESQEADNEDVNIPQVKRSMTKEYFVAALNLLGDENSQVTAVFQFKEHWGSSFKSDISGLKLIFEPDGLHAILEVKEAAKEIEIAA